MSCLRGAQCCSDEVTSLYIPARRSADGWLRSKFFKTSSRDKVTTYITWVNNQLSKHGTGHQISSLEKGLSDGVTLPQLLHVLGDEPVPGVTIPPYTEAMRKGNIRLCFQYLQLRHIHPRNSTAPDVSNGNLKCIMRLLLALAANFKTYRADNNANKSRSLAGYSSSNGQSNVRSLINSQEQKSKEQSQHVQQENLADEEEIHWMYDQVVDTRKQIESLKHLLLKEAEGEQLLATCQCNELSERLTTTEDMVETVTDKLNSAQQALVERDETILQLRAQLLRMKVTNDHSPTNNDKTISDLQVKLSVKEETLKRLVDKNEDFPESKNCSEELLAARQCLDALRLSLAVDSPGQHRLDHLEQILNVTVQRNKRENRNNRRPVKTLTSDGSTCSSQGEYNMNTSPFANRHTKSNNNDNTKILYYMDNSTTPYLSQIQKKLGQITLSDFKEVFDRSGHYRYHFKSVDTEFGPVKEELVGDDAIIPGWEGRIVGWVEELSSSLDHVEI